MRNVLGRLLIVWIFVLCPLEVKAQAQNSWSEPMRISDRIRGASEGLMVTDKYGYVYLFWTEEDKDEERFSIYYSRFDGNAWTKPIDVAITRPGLSIMNFAPAVDPEGGLHLVWSEDDYTSYYIQAPFMQTPSAKPWTRPLTLGAPANRFKLQVDSLGVRHLVYNIMLGNDVGVHYMRSLDSGESWSNPVRLDPDIPAGATPQWLAFDLGDDGALHVLWDYFDMDAALGTTIRYAHSLDGGESWSPALDLDTTSSTDQSLQMPFPDMVVSGKNIYAIWGRSRPENQANPLAIFRRYRISNDAGLTWSEPRWMMGDLNGQAIGSGLDVDSQGRIHYLVQMRWPMAIWHTYWDGNAWSAPTTVYFIARDDPESQIINATRSRVHAHNVREVIRNGNQLVMAFTDSPSVGAMGLYVTTRMIDDAMPFVLLPTPPATPKPIATATATLQPTPTATPSLKGPERANTIKPQTATAPTLVLGTSLLPALLLISSVALIHLWRRR